MGQKVVVFPDYKGEGALGEFGRVLKDMYPNYIPVPVLNGLSEAELKKIAKKITGFDPVISLGKGLLPALVTGYSHVIAKYPSATIVRLDTSEHPIGYIATMVVQSAVRDGIMVVGDLDFSAGTLRKESIDEFAHLDLFPILYQQFCGVAVSCAHGFQAFGPGGICKKVFAGALKIVEEVERTQDSSISWGFDGAMILSAARQMVPVVIKKAQAFSLLFIFD